MRDESSYSCRESRYSTTIFILSLEMSIADLLEESKGASRTCVRLKLTSERARETCRNVREKNSLIVSTLRIVKISKYSTTTLVKLFEKVAH